MKTITHSVRVPKGITEQLQEGIENLDDSFYEEIKLNSQEIIDDRIYEIDLYFENLKDKDYYIQLEEEYSLWESHTSEYDYELYLIQENLSEFYGLFDPNEK